jgi:hypothetical protein
MARAKTTKAKSNGDLASRVARANALLDELTNLFPELASLTADERQHSQGKMRAGEIAQLRTILDVIDGKPSLFEGLADEDFGEDPTRLETDLLRHRLDEVEALAPLIGTVEALATQIGDTTLFTGARVRPVLLAAYRIAKPLANKDKAIGGKLAGVISYYAGPAAAAAKTRKKKKAAQK